MLFSRKNPRSFRIMCGVLVLAIAGAGVFAWREWEGEGAESESFAEFAKEYAGRQHTLPLAVMREKLESGGEASREKLSGPAQEDYDNRAYPNTYIDDAKSNDAMLAFKTADQRTQLAASRGQLDARDARKRGDSWTEVGPFTPIVPAEVTYTGRETTNSGRITWLAVAPRCRDGDCKLFAGAAGGGIWMTNDALAATPKWQPTSESIPSNAIGTVIFDPTDSTGKTLYVGTGEPNGSSDSEAGVGLFKSTDGGKTWSLVPGSLPVAKDRSIASIVIDPKDSKHIYIGTAVARHGSASVNGGRFTPPDAPKIGLYESTDGGTTFNLSFSQVPDVVDPSTATGNDYFKGGVTEIVLDPQDSNTVYAALINYGLWRRSPKLDGNSDFHQVFAPLNPDTFGERVDIAVTAKNAKTRIYAGIGPEQQFDDQNNLTVAGTLWRVDNAGVPAATLLASQTGSGGWKNLSSPKNGDPGFASYNFCAGQCSYDMPVESPPGRPDEVWIAGQMMYDELPAFGSQTPRSNGRAVQRSTDAGVSFTDMTDDAQKPAIGMHPDQHAIAFDPDNPSIAFLGSDGGIVRTNGKYVNRSDDCNDRSLKGADLKDCKNWLSSIPERIFSLNDGLRTLQFQSISINPHNGGRDVLGGTQDNGTWAYNGSPVWFESVGGDGGQSGIDYGNAQIRMHTYFSSQVDVNFHGTNVKTWDWNADPLIFSGEAASFYVPLIPDLRASGTWFTGLQHVWRTKDNGGDPAFLDAHCNTNFGDKLFTGECGDWEPIGADLSGDAFGTDKGGNAPGANYVVATERARNDRGTLWAATRRGRLFISQNADATATDVKFMRIDTVAQPQRFVSGIMIDQANPNHAWVSFSGYNAYTPTTPGHIFEVTFDPASGIATWKDLSFDIGDQPITDIARDSNTGDLYASTDFGVLRLPAGGSNWTTAAPGMPQVAVYGLSVSPASRTLYAATHGRGAWRLRLSE